MRMRIAITLVVIGLAASAVSAQLNARDRAMAAYKAGLDHMRAEAFEDAEKAFGAAVELDAAFEMAYYMLGRAQMPQKKFTTAASSFSKARELYVATAGRRFANMQEAQRYRRDRMLEIDEVIRQVQSAPQNQQAQNQLRQLNDRKRLLQEQTTRGDDVSIASNVPSYVSLSLGSAYFRTGNLAEAEKFYQEAIAADPRAGEAHSNLAVVFMETGRLDAAEKSIKAAEKAGFKVHPQLKEEIKNRRKVGSI